MNHLKRLSSWAVLAVTLQLVPAQALAWVDIQTRCRGDVLTRKVDIEGRNKWALKCGIITERELDAVNLLGGYYWSLVHMNQDTSRAPARESQDCEQGWVKGTPCRPGCFADTEQLLLGGTYQTLSDAYAKQQGTVTVLAPEATCEHLAFAEEAIEAFTRGPEQEALIRFETAAGKRLTVTQSHPMVDVLGSVVAASEVREGTSLLTVDGPEEVVAVQSIPYDGEVWNLRAQSTRPKSNVHIAQGFLTGSERYQAEWASEAARLLLRDSLREVETR